MSKLTIFLLAIGFSITAGACSSADKKAEERNPNSSVDKEQHSASYQRHLQMLERVDNMR